MAIHASKLDLTFKPLTPERWPDFEALFGPRGACGGCWCMFWRLSRSAFDSQKGDGNKRAMRKLVDTGEVPGLLAYHAGKPAGWIAVAPRDQYVRLEKSRVLKPVDDAPVWSVVCFFVARPYRNKGISVQLLEAAAKFVKGQGGVLLEGYPAEARKGRMPDVFAWTGLPAAFRKAGFHEVARRSPTRPIMRLPLAASQPRKKEKKNKVVPTRTRVK